MTTTEPQTSSSPPARWPGWLWWLPALVGVVLILLTPWPPMLDWPLHIAQGSLLANWGDPSFVPEGIYCRTPFQSYHLFHYMVSGLYQLVGPHWVSRASLLVLFGMYHLAVWGLLRLHRADTRAIALATPAFFGFLYLMGFGSFLLGVPFFLLSLGVAEGWTQRGGWRWGVALLLCTLATFWLHLLVCYLTLACLGARWVVEWAWDRTWRWRFVVALLVPGLLAVSGMFGLNTHLRAQKSFWDTVKAQHPTLHWTSAEPSLGTKLLSFPSMLIANQNAAWRDALLGWLLLGLVVGLLALRVWRRRKQGQPLAWGRWALALTPFFLYLVFPKKMMNVNFVHGRFVLPTFLLLLALIPADLSHRWSRWLLRLGLLVSLTLVSLNTLYHLEWTEAMEGLHKVIDKLPPKPRLLGVLTQFRHAPAIVQTYRGGETRLSFTYYRHMPVVDCALKRQTDTWAISMDVRTFRPHQHKWDYLLLYLDRRGAQLRALYPWLFQKNTPYRPTFRAGPWLLLRHHKK